jgi:hypothetical protein
MNRETDKLINQRIMNNPTTWKETPFMKMKTSETPFYTKDISEAWKVVNKMIENGFWFQLNLAETSEDQFECRFQLDEIDEVAIAVTAQEAICLAALKTLRNDVW